ncbi:hypothetical protein T11_3022 [Trichinella zimbabwensis]|uniref:PiggyBac transposable element-derived protein domain-containing protein n=1 Tax=Trichinella zimbabwensis TaxID=268475 RepID=A0A0V1GQE5_9BILA|nr:hypothetical protein T11_773 [Trichinella zimbabwensis]KRZ00568.1 hypothetical protein T11_3022 [Trichinella zimbabwensis]
MTFVQFILMTLRIAAPLLYHNNFPHNEIYSQLNLKKLANGESRFIPPLAVAREISTATAGGLKVTIYSKSEKSRYGKSALLLELCDCTFYAYLKETHCRDLMNEEVLVKMLKSTIKVWTTRYKTLKSVTNPITVDGLASFFENDVSQWIVNEPGNKVCAVDKPYTKVKQNNQQWLYALTMVPFVVFSIQYLRM